MSGGTAGAPAALTVRAVEDKGITRGAVGPHLMACDDGKTYLVKFAVPDDRSAVNEFVGYKLASRLDMPVPPSALVAVEEDIISASADLRQRVIRPGLHLGSRMVPDAYDLHDLQTQRIKDWRGIPDDAYLLGDIRIINSEQLPGTVCLDNWILTKDRNRAANHLLQPAGSAYRYFMIDFTHSFTGTTWTAQGLTQNIYFAQLMPTYPLIVKAISGPASLDPTLRALESISDDEIDSMVSAVPLEWNLSREDSSALSAFLRLRRPLVRELLMPSLRRAGG